MRLASFCVLLSMITGCAASQDDASSASAAAESAGPTAAPVLDCGRPGSFDEAAMLALAGTYQRDGVAPANGLESLTVGPLESISGSGSKKASYTRDMAAPCDAASCTGQTGTLTTLYDNPAIGAYLAFDDGSGSPSGQTVYYVTNSLLDDHGTLQALCLGDAVTGASFLLTRSTR